MHGASGVFAAIGETDFELFHDKSPDHHYQPRVDTFNILSLLSIATTRHNTYKYINGGNAMDMATIGKRIAELRKQKTITQEALAAATGVSVQAVSKWENGGSPDAALLPTIADFFGVSIDFLFGHAQANLTAQETAMQLRKHLASVADLQPGNYGWLGNTKEMTDILFDICYDAYCFYITPEPTQSFQQVKPTVQNQLCNNTIQNDMYGHAIVPGGRMYMDIHPLPLFILMAEPEGGWQKLLPNAEQYATFFKTLSCPSTITALLWLIQQPPHGTIFTARHLAATIGINEEKTQSILTFMLEKSIITTGNPIRIDDNDVAAYSPNYNNSILLPLLAVARIMVMGTRLSGAIGYRWNDNIPLM